MLRIVWLTCLISSLSFAQRALIGGTLPEAESFPASVLTNGCTATIVGPRAVFTAAHCVDQAGISFRFGGQIISATCLISREFSTNTTADYALCEPEIALSGVKFESINFEPNRIQVGTSLLLTGFGCTQPSGNGGNDGIYRVGTATVARIPRGSDNDIITQGSSALCFGDSGGPAFLVDEQTNTRYVVAANSRGNIRDTSFLSATHTNEGRRFFQAWIAATGNEVCGLSELVQGCRNISVAPIPDEPPIDDNSIPLGDTFQISSNIAELNVIITSGNEDKFLQIKAAIERAIKRLELNEEQLTREAL